MIEVCGLEKRFGPHTAVQGLSFAISEGESFALLGHNGSGKTTTLKCLAGLVRPTAGRIRIDGVDLTRQPAAARARLSFLPQKVAFDEHLTAREVLRFYCGLRRLDLRKADQALEEYGLTDAARRTVRHFSGGMLQRLGIAVAGLAGAPVLLLDEPTASLDPKGALEFRGLIRSLRRQGRTIVFSSHVLADVEELADRAALMVNGRLAGIESMESLRLKAEQTARLRIRLRQPAGPFAAAVAAFGVETIRAEGTDLVVAARPDQRMPVLRHLESQGAAIESFRTEEASLEEVYLRYGQTPLDTSRCHAQPGCLYGRLAGAGAD